ncbi:Rpn family recombination-promoting nuclease/putative transposase [Rickettsiaceae bacterium]|nr:Rpn family recombination-promoting nuclease/putative transposase [Rickettsiaceae bacterium]
MDKKNQSKKRAYNAPHDELAKKALENQLAAIEFLDEYMPAEFKEHVDLSTLVVKKESYIESSLKKRFSDIVYSIKTKDNDEAFIYCLLEHQSSSDHWMALRLWQYALLLCERHKKKKNKLPLVLPLILYNGKEKYTAPRNIWELFDNPDLAKKALAGDYRLVDLQAMSDEDIDYEKHLSFLLYVMKHIHQRDTLKMLREAMQTCAKAILIDKGQDYLHTKLILWYTDAKVPIEHKHELEQLIVDNLPKKDSEDVMTTIAQAYIEEGEARGIAKRNTEIARRMLQEKTDLKFISYVTGLSSDEILKLKSKTQIAS